MTVMDMHKNMWPQSLLICEFTCFQSIATDVWNQTPRFANFVKKLDSTKVLMNVSKYGA